MKSSTLFSPTHHLVAPLPPEANRTMAGGSSPLGSVAPSLPSPDYGLTVHQITRGHKSLPGPRAQGKSFSNTKH